MRSFFSISALLLASQLVAQQAPPATPTDPTDQAVQPSTPGAPSPAEPARRPVTFRGRATHDQHSQRKILRGSAIIGLNVKNRADEDLGSINDIVIDPQDGRVVYAAVSMGGFLGVGDKLFAVPWSAIEFRNLDNNNEGVAYVDIDKQRLENAQGFNQENWPDMASQQWRTANDRPYRTQRSQRHEVLKPVQPSDAAGDFQGRERPNSIPSTTPKPPQQ